MHDFHYHNSELFCEEVSVASVAKKFGTPLYVYSQGTIERHFQKLDAALADTSHLVCFSVKSNSNLAVLASLARLGSGFDIVSAGELERVLQAGGSADRCVFAGVGKTEPEIEFALKQGVYSFNIESEPELQRINQLAGRMKRIAPVAVRVNPNVAAHTHKKITTGTYENKFGIAIELVESLYRRMAKLKHVRLRGLQMHIGSQITDVKPFEEAVRRVVPLFARLRKAYGLEFLSIGGGLGIVYEPALASGPEAWWRTSAAKGILTPSDFAKRLLPLLQPLGVRLLIEPGRFISGNAGILVTRIEYVKKTGRKNFLIVDAAMNDLIRPAFYEAYHEIVPVTRHRGASIKSDVVGPICESGDFFAQDRPLPKLGQGELLALMSAGAYGSVMGSNYNTRPFPAEVLVRGNRAALVRERQPVRQIWSGESLAPWLSKKRT